MVLNYTVNQFMIKKYTKAKLKHIMIKSILFFQKMKFQKKKTRYSCIATICIDSVLKLSKGNYPQVYLQQSKYKRKRS